MVQTETAQVYRGGGRRFFTRKAAERSEAKSIIRTRCECEHGDGSPYGYPGQTCTYHAMAPQQFERLVHLLIIMFIRKPEPSPHD